MGLYPVPSQDRLFIESNKNPCSTFVCDSLQVWIFNMYDILCVYVCDSVYIHV